MKSAGFDVTYQKRGEIHILCIDWTEQPKQVKPVEQWQKEKGRVRSQIRYAMQHGWNHIQTWIALRDYEKVIKDLEYIGYHITVQGMNKELVHIYVEWIDEEIGVW